MDLREKIILLNRMMKEYEIKYKDELEYDPDVISYPLDEEAMARTADKCYGLRFLTTLKYVFILLAISAEETPGETINLVKSIAPDEILPPPGSNELSWFESVSGIGALAQAATRIRLIPSDGLEGFRESFTAFDASVNEQSTEISKIDLLAIVGDIVLRCGVGSSIMEITKASTCGVVMRQQSSSAVSDNTIKSLLEAARTYVVTRSAPISSLNSLFAAALHGKKGIDRAHTLIDTLQQPDKPVTKLDAAIVAIGESGNTVGSMSTIMLEKFEDCADKEALINKLLELKSAQLLELKSAQLPVDFAKLVMITISDKFSEPSPRSSLGEDESKEEKKPRFTPGVIEKMVGIMADDEYDRLDRVDVNLNPQSNEETRASLNP